MTTPNMPGDDVPPYEPGTTETFSTTSPSVGAGYTGTGSTGSTGSSSTGSDDSKTEKAKQTASAAADESKHVAGVAKDQAQNVAGEAKNQAKGLANEALSQVDDQARTQRDRLVDTLRSFSDDLEQMASQGGRSGMATDLARQVADKARGLTDSIDGRDPSDLLDELRDFARRKPGTFLVGAAAAGMVAGRFLRGTKAAHEHQSNGSAGSSSRTATGTSGLYDDPRAGSLGTEGLGTPGSGSGSGYSTPPAYPAGGAVTGTADEPYTGGTTGTLS